MSKKKKQEGDEWIEELRRSGYDVQSELIEDDPQEEKEIAQAYQQLQKDRKERRPTRRWKWKKSGLWSNRIERISERTKDIYSRNGGSGGDPFECAGYLESSLVMVSW